MERNSRIDFIKGILIIFVIVGHVLYGPLMGNFARYMIYSFHIPLFLGLNGLLLNKDRLVNEKFIKIFSFYFFRLILPWIIAWSCYAIIDIIINGFTPSFVYISRFIFPTYHLWYVPALIVYIFFTWLLLIMETRGSMLLVISILLVIIVEVYSNFFFVYSVDLTSEIIKNILAKYKHQY